MEMSELKTFVDYLDDNNISNVSFLYKLSKEQVLEMMEKIRSGANREALYKEYGCTGSSFYRASKYYRIPLLQTREVTTRYTILQDLGNEYSSYYLGLFLTDGYVNHDRITLELQDKDVHILQTLADFVNLPYDRIKHRKNRNCSWINLSSISLSEFYHNIGLVQNKSLTLELKNTEFNWHIIRGIFDGDGGIYYSKKQDKIEFFSASEKFIDQIKTFLFENGILSDKQSKKKERENTLYSLRISNKVSVLKLIHNMYSDAHVYLFRKHDIAHNVCERIIASSKLRERASLILKQDSSLE